MIKPHKEKYHQLYWDIAYALANVPIYKKKETIRYA